MTFEEAKTAKRLLSPYTTREEVTVVEISIYGDHTSAVTAYWRDGGQTVFYSLEVVEDRLFERTRTPIVFRIEQDGG